MRKKSGTFLFFFGSVVLFIRSVIGYFSVKGRSYMGNRVGISNGFDNIGFTIGDQDCVKRIADERNEILKESHGARKITGSLETLYSQDQYS